VGMLATDSLDEALAFVAEHRHQPYVHVAASHTLVHTTDCGSRLHSTQSWSVFGRCVGCAFTTDEPQLPPKDCQDETSLGLCLHM